MSYAIECHELGFVCEAQFDSGTEGSVLEDVLAHLSDEHRTGSSDGLKKFVSAFVHQVQNPDPADRPTHLALRGPIRRGTDK